MIVFNLKLVVISVNSLFRPILFAVQVMSDMSVKQVPFGQLRVGGKWRKESNSRRGNSEIYRNLTEMAASSLNFILL